MDLPVTALYAGLLAILMIALAIPVGQLRGKTGVSILDGGNPELAVAMRRHQNFTEWVPMALILLGVLELNGVSHLVLHVMGILLVVFRIAHPAGLKAETTQGLGRLIGAGGTTVLIAVMAVWAIITAL